MDGLGINDGPDTAVAHPELLDVLFPAIGQLRQDRHFPGGLSRFMERLPLLDIIGRRIQLG